uniref:Uncharacterized protein n=1 Tax=Sus scrofa TaxID=9823 RepID=A0A4X1WB20_PIG
MLASLETDVANRLRVCAPNEVGYQFCAVCTAARWDAGVVMSLHYSVSLAFRGLKCKPLNCAYWGGCNRRDSATHGGLSFERRISVEATKRDRELDI